MGDPQYGIGGPSVPGGIPVTVFGQQAGRPVPPPQRRGPGLLTTITVATITSLVVGGVAGFAGYLLGRESEQPEPSATTAELVTQEAEVATAIGADLTTISQIVASSLPSVVYIEIDGDGQMGSGSGFVIREDGYILTNNHVAAPAANGGTLTVYFDNGTSAQASIVGRNTSYDLAVIKVAKEDLPPMVLGNSDSVKVGDPAIAIGAPLGLEGTVTAGIISSRDRAVTAGGSGDLAYINAIQTDAAINPGNSGGPLLDSAGRVIGVNSAIATLAQSITGEGGSIGLGFAIPINSAKRIAEEIIATGTSQTTIIGVSLDTAYEGEGARVREVTSGGPAEAAGIAVGDIITGIGGRPTRDATELVVAIRSYAPGDVVPVDFTRNGTSSSVDITLGGSDNIS